VCLDVCCDACSWKNVESRAAGEGAGPLLERSAFSFLPKLHKNPIHGLSTSPPARLLPNATAEMSATVRSPSGGGTQGRKPLPCLTLGVTSCPSLCERVVVVSGLVPQGRLGRGNQVLPASGPTQTRGHEAPRPAGEEPNSSLLSKQCLPSSKCNQPSHRRAGGLLEDPFCGGIAWGEAGPRGSSRGSELAKRTWGGTGAGGPAMPAHGAWRGGCLHSLTRCPGDGTKPLCERE